jgi:hypothetical protein
MTDWFKVRASSWTDAYGQAFRRYSPEVRELAQYLRTGPLANQWGLYTVEIHVAVLHTGRSAQVVTRALGILATIGYAQYDAATGWVWIPEMAGEQLDAPLKAVDGRALRAKRWYQSAPANPFLGLWWDRYCIDLCLEKEPEPVERREGVGTITPLDAAPQADLPLEIPPAAVTLPAAQRPPSRAFATIKEAYPNRQGIAAARREFVMIKPTAEVVATILAAIDIQRRNPKWAEHGGQYIPKLENWLRDERWLDQPTEVPHLSERTSHAVAGLTAFVEGGPCATPERSAQNLRERSLASSTLSGVSRSIRSRAPSTGTT